MGGLLSKIFRSQIIILLVLTPITCALAMEQGQESQKTSRQNSDIDVFDPDVPPKTQTELLPFLTFGGKLEFEYEFEHNFTLDHDEDADVSTLASELSLAFSFDPHKNFQAFVDFETSGELELEDGELTSNEVRLELKQAFFSFKTIFDSRFSLQVGRQRFNDSREWLYDEDLDAVRVFYRIADFSLELSVSRRDLVDRDLLNSNGREKINNYLVYGKYALHQDLEIATYFLARDDQSAEQENRSFFGLHSRGEIIDDLEYWFELAHVWSRDGSRKRRGVGLDVGVTYAFDFALKPSVTFGYAFGSKDFQQTGLQENEDKFNGVVNFKYYGTLFDPELSNLSIFTIGVGIRPARKSSIDIVYHYYLQHKAADEIRDSAIDVEPTGENRSLGSEIDLVVGYEKIRNLEIALMLGYFIPGRAFSAESNASFFAKLEIQFHF